MPRRVDRVPAGDSDAVVILIERCWARVAKRHRGGLVVWFAGLDELTRGSTPRCGRR